MKKKIIAMLLSVALMTGLMMGCGNGGAPAADTPAADVAEDVADAADDAADDDTDEAPPVDTGDMVTLTLMIDRDTPLAGIEGVIAAAQAELGINIEIEIRPGGLEGENLLRTRLATGDMSDLIFFNSGALLHTLNPSEHFIDISNEPFVDRLDESFIVAVSEGDAIYGVPAGTFMAGAIIYCIAMYEAHGLEVPNTWDEFMENIRVLDAAGETAIIGTYADAWTSQVMWLGDAYNLFQAEPDFAVDFEAGIAKWENTPAALRGFEKLAEVNPYLNSDFLAMTFDEGVDIMANGEAGHWAMLSFVLTVVYDLYGREAADGLGIFGIPGDDGDRGLTVWVPNAIYGNAASEHREEILAFMEFFVSEAGAAAFVAAQPPEGPLGIRGFELPETALRAARYDMQAYFDAGRSAPALEFITAIKGPNAPNITQAIGAGQMSPLEGAIQYDEDCANQARQLGFDW